MEIEWMRNAKQNVFSRPQKQLQPNPYVWHVYIAMNLPLCRCFNSHKHNTKSIFKWVESFKWVTVM